MTRNDDQKPRKEEPPRTEVDRARAYLDLWEAHMSLVATRGSKPTPERPAR